ncbi:hypothetical protein C8F01DRAFT_1092663 [Mycena amicta]|nr:hypothetical protein C8F01DRAFT_1092663 [Mycena amicta]
MLLTSFASMPPLAQAFGFWILVLNTPSPSLVSLFFSALNVRNASTSTLCRRRVHQRLTSPPPITCFNLNTSTTPPKASSDVEADPDRYTLFIASPPPRPMQSMLSTIREPLPRIFPAIYDVTPLRRSARSSWPNTRYSRIDNDLKHAGDGQERASLQAFGEGFSGL